MSKTIIISNRLPVKVNQIEHGFQFTSSEGGLATGLGSMHSADDTIWIGWPGIAVKNKEDEANITSFLDKRRLVPVFLSEEDINEYYEGFSNDIIWPIFHYYASVHANYKQSNWEYYKSVNQKFLDVVTRVAGPDDTIWVHDYQLLLLPGLLRSALPGSTIGFFQHIPFPSFELFRLIPWRSELIAGMLGADLLGFHTFNDVRHFLDAATQLAPVNTSANSLTYEGRMVLAESFPMGIDNRRYLDLAKSDVVKQHVAEVKAVHTNKRRLILSIDRLDYSKGILQRLQAFELLLESNPEYVGEVALHMIVVPSRDTVPQYRDLKELIDRRVGEINAKYRTINWTPVYYFYRPFPIEELSALYLSADICMVTPMRDGMNLVSKEYVASRVNQDGVLILSEMAGAAKELVDAILVNPSNIASMRDAIVTGLTMPKAEQKRRMVLMQRVVAKFTVAHWMKLFMSRLAEVKQMQTSLSTRHITDITAKAIRKVYHKSRKRIIFLDYDGTLVGFNPEISAAVPDEELYRILQRLCNDPINKIVLISGRSHADIEEWFGHLNLELIAEHGAWQKTDGIWHSAPGISDHWKSDIRPLMETYADRTPGAFVEEKDYSLVWHYRKVETGLGELRTSELMNNLRYLTNDRGLQLLAGNKVVEIKSIEINKGKAAAAKLKHDDYDFIMAFGDDHTDEDIFKTLPDDSITVKVGSNISAARFYLRDPEKVRALLQDVAIPISEEQFQL
ncbi:bifunctional alpha,alpha-trehalose-phosphate synthase (UDP-forming)/trehalose-phosphatase [Daejeonella lutea]|nr:bifunctional alpha,alpha-trehalose-phosphate synthase (UDP-forming)/trehalose-phosphatase [Daejeonella lutea]